MIEETEKETVEETKPVETKKVILRKKDDEADVARPMLRGHGKPRFTTPETETE